MTWRTYTNAAILHSGRPCACAPITYRRLLPAHAQQGALSAAPAQAFAAFCQELSAWRYAGHRHNCLRLSQAALTLTYIPAAQAGAPSGLLAKYGQVRDVALLMVARPQQPKRRARGRQEDPVEPGVEELELQLAAQHVRDDRPARAGHSDGQSDTAASLPVNPAGVPASSACTKCRQPAEAGLNCPQLAEASTSFG